MGFRMPLELAREMAKEYRRLADDMHAEADALESGKCRYITDNLDVSVSRAADLRHRARNIETFVIAFERISAREELKRFSPDQSAQNGGTGSDRQSL